MEVLVEGGDHVPGHLEPLVEAKAVLQEEAGHLPHIHLSVDPAIEAHRPEINLGQDPIPEEVQDHDLGHKWQKEGLKWIMKNIWQ